MTENLQVEAIADVYTDFPAKFGLPRQSGRAPALEGRIVFREKYRNPEAVRGLERFSHIWILFDFSQAHTDEWSPTVRPPRLGGNTRGGVFASRSPYRPNPIGLSCVKLERIEQTQEGNVLIVSGVDLLNGTPVLDIKPYIPYADCRTEAKGDYADEHAEDSVDVVISENMLQIIPPDKREALIQCLADDPRPQYQDDSSRVYKMRFAGWDVHFRVSGRELQVVEIVPDGEGEETGPELTNI